MAKKIKFALEMAEGIKVRTIEDLRAHFDMERVMMYFSDGKLLEWLEDRYYDKETAAVKEMTGDEADFKQQLCAVFGVEYQDDDVSMEEVELVQEKKAKLKQMTSDEEIINHAAETAFSQEELADLLDEGVQTIYLCGDTFHIPASVKGQCYIGILGEPEIHIDVESREELNEKQITFEHVTLPEYLQAEKETECPARRKAQPYTPSKLFDFILSDEDREKAEKLYNVAQDILGNVHFDPDAGSRPLEKVVRESNLKGAFAKYLERL